MKRSLFIIVLIAITISQWSFAQENVTVYLRNGTKLIGELTESDRNGRMTVETPNGTMVYFTEKSVKEIVYDDDKVPVRRSFRTASTVCLRNGSILIGRLTESEDSGRSKLETPNGSVIYFTENAVRDIERNEIQSASANNRSRSFDDEPVRGNRSYARPEVLRDERPQYKTKGYRGFVETGYTVGIGDFPEGRIELSTSHGYQFSPYLFLGGGMAEHYYHSQQGSFIPLFVDFRANFTNGSVVPFFGVKVGYSIGVSSDYISTGGAYLAPAFGVKFRMGYSFALNLSAGYTYQNAEVFDWDNYDFYDANLGGLSFKIGIEF